MMSRNRFIPLLILLLTISVGLLVTGVIQARNTIEVTDPDKISSAPAVDGSVQGFYTQTVEWRPCDAQEITHPLVPAPKNLSPYECATVQAPLDWDKPDGDTISLSVAIHRSGHDQAPALFFNLGGPGGPSVRSLSSQVRDSLGDDIVEKYDIVALDPRGVGASTPVQCLTDHEQDNFNAWGVISDADVEKAKLQAQQGTELSPEEEIAQTQRLFEEFAQGCQRMTGDLSGYLGTRQAAKDFDMVRALLGQEKFNYLGYSYGTFLGATYADLFPSSVGLMVLDAAVDPGMEQAEIAALQLKGFDDSLKHWIDDCQAGPGCPLPGDQREGIARVKQFLERLEKHPLPTADPDRPLTQSLALSGMIGAMYDERYYSILTEGMNQALTQNDGSVLLRFVDILSSRNDDGTYLDNSGQAIIAINALDYVANGNEKDWIAKTQQLRSELDIVDIVVGYDDAGLSVWPFKGVTERKVLTAEGAGPIVVIGQTHDPATPYVMSQNLSGQLHNSVLVTVEGWSHGAYSKTADPCVIEAVENYFVNGEVPKDGLTCK